MLNSSRRALRWRNTASLGRPARAEERTMCPLVVHCHHGLGLLYVAIGQHEKARTALTTAIELCRAMEMACWLPQAEPVLARVDARWREGKQSSLFV
jgi:hypothetical protein